LPRATLEKQEGRRHQELWTGTLLWRSYIGKNRRISQAPTGTQFDDTVCVCVCVCVCVRVCVCASASASASACACVSSACGGPANLTVKDGYCCVCSANRKVNGRWTFIKEILNIAPVCNTPQCNPPEPRGGSARAVRAPSAPRCEPNQKRTRQPDAPDTADDDSSTTRHYVTRSVRRKLAPTPSPPASPSPKQKSYDLSLMSP